MFVEFMESNLLNMETVKIRKYQSSFSKIDIMGHVRLLKEDDLPSIINLQQIIVDSLSDANMFEPSSETSLYEYIRTHGKIIGIFVEKQLVAFRVIYFPGFHQDNLGYDLNLLPEELNQVAHLESVIVHPDYRGNSLALKMNIQALEIMQSLNYKHVCATVSPQNIYNLNVLFKLGFTIWALKKKYESKLRYIFYKNLDNSAQKLTFYPEKSITIAIADIIAQQNILQQKWIGYQMETTSEGRNITFGQQC